MKVEWTKDLFRLNRCVWFWFICYLHSKRSWRYRVWFVNDSKSI